MVAADPLGERGVHGVSPIPQPQPERVAVWDGADGEDGGVGQVATAAVRIYRGLG